MLGSMIVAAVEVSLVNIEACSATLVQMQKMFEAGDPLGEAKTMRDRLGTLQRAFADALADPPPAGEDLLSMIRANYKRRLAEETAD